MFQRPLLSRIDAHMERGNELMAEIREEMARGREDRADLRVFIRDITRRNEIVLQGVASELSELRAETRAGTEEIRAHMREETSWIRAQTDAILEVLDRLPPRDGPAAQGA
jgi:hypothetical protein